MEQEKILSTLSEKLGKTSLSQRTLNDYVALNLPGEGTEPDEAYWEKHLGVLKSLGGNLSHDVAAQVEDFKKNYKPTANNPEPLKPVDAPKADDELSKRIAALEQQLADEKKSSQEAALRNAVQAKGDELKVSNKALWNDAVKMAAIGEGADEAKLTDEAKRIYEAKLKAYIGEGASPYGGEQRGGAPKVSDKEAEAKREAFKAKQRASGRLPQNKN